jgi:hypothetical protein
MKGEVAAMQKMQPKILIRNLIIEIVLYSLLLVGYYFLVLRQLQGWIQEIFMQNLTLYAFVGLGLILIQGAFLDLVTTLLLKYIKLDQFGLRRFLDVFSNR